MVVEETILADRATRPAPDDQRVREAAEDERDRLFEIARNYVRNGVDVFSAVVSFLGDRDAMLPADRAAARRAIQSETKGADE